MDNFLRILSLDCCGGLICFMTYQGSAELSKKWFDHLPIFWKRKVRNFIKKDRQHALNLFFRNYRKKKDLDRMRYGLEQLLPSSLQLILSSFEEFNSEEIMSFFELMATPAFLTQIFNLDRKNQEFLLTQINRNWNSELNQDSIRLILSHLEPDLVEMIFQEISNQKSESIISQSLEIMKLWGAKILPIVLKLYLKTPTDRVDPLFKELTPKERVHVFFGDINILKSQFKNLLQLISPTEDEINYLFESQPSISEESKELLTDWLLNQNFSENQIMQFYHRNKTDENQSFITRFFVTGIQKKIYHEIDVIVSILFFKDFPIAHKILKMLNSSKEQKNTEILLSSLNKLGTQALEFSKFFQAELKIYAPQKIEAIVKYYLNKEYESHQKLLLPILQEVANRKWKIMIKTIVETQTHPFSDSVFDIFSSCSQKTKQNIGKYIIDQSWISILLFLYRDFEIFVSALISRKELSITMQALLEPLLQQHVSERFENIVRLGKKITFPQLAFASIMNDTYLKTLVDTIGSQKDLLLFWEDTILTCSKDALPVLLNKFSTKKDKSKKDLIPLLTKLIDLEPSSFWLYFKSMSARNIVKLESILSYAFKISIPNIGEILIQLPEKHQSFLIDRILPQFKSLGSKILYSLFSFQQTSKIQEKVIQRTILKVVGLDPEDFLVIALIRCSKRILDPEIENFVSELIENLLTQYPEDFMVIVDSQKLNSLLSSISSYLTSLSQERVEILLITIIPTLQSNLLISTIVDHLVLLVRKREGDVSLLDQLCSTYETGEFTAHGESVLRDFVMRIVEEPSTSDLSIFAIIHEKPRNQILLSPIFFGHTSLHIVEEILLNPPIDPLEGRIIKAAITHFESHPPEKPEEYFFSLYTQARGKDEVQRAILPLLGEHCSWQNLSVIMELPEKDKYKSEYEKALKNFSLRFNIQSPYSLRQIWISGLKDVYNRMKQPDALYQSQCPQCGNPVLENQKNCGFCSQRLSCIICRRSVVRFQVEEEVIRCPHCSSFFHRQHLLESIKIKKGCPVCNVALKEAEVNSLPIYTFLFK